MFLLLSCLPHGCSLSVDCSSLANSCSSSKTQHGCPLLWESFTSLFSQLPSTVSPFSDPSLLFPCSRFPGTALLQAIGFFAKPQFCYLLHSVWLPTGLHPYLLGALTWIHCRSSYSAHYIISLVSFTHITLFHFSQFRHCYIVPSCFHTSSVYFTSGSPLLSHLLPSPQPPPPVIPELGEEESGGWQRGALGQEGTSCLFTGGSGLVMRDLPPLPSISLHRPSSCTPPPLSAHCSSPSSHPFLSASPALVPPRPLPQSLLGADGNLSSPGCDSGAQNPKSPLRDRGLEGRGGV